MFTLFFRWLLLSLALMLTAWIVPGIRIEGFLAAMLAAVVIGFVNLFIRPMVMFLTLPINLLTLGLFTFVVNALMLLLVAWIVPGMAISGFFAAFLGSIVLSIFSLIINWTTHTVQYAHN